MPDTTAFIDALRHAFGKDEIDGQIRKATKGEPTFYAKESGREIGTRTDVGSQWRVRFDPVTGNAVSEEIKRG